MTRKASSLIAARMMIVALGLTPAVLAQQPATTTTPVVSPEVMPDRTVVFRLRAPQATSVRLAGSDIPALGGGRGAAGAPSPGQMTK